MTWFADTASWALILGVLTPILTSVIQQPKWSDQVRSIIAALVSIVVGVVTVLANGGFVDASGSLGIIALVMVSSYATYRNLWKPSGIAPAIESATSPSTGRHEVGRADVTYIVGLVVVVILVVILIRLVF